MFARASDDHLAERLLGRKPGRSLADLFELDRGGLEQAGLSGEEAVAIMVVAEIARRHQPTEVPAAIRHPRQVVSVLADLRRASASSLLVLLLDRHEHLLAVQRVAEAEAGCATASPRHVAEVACEGGASAAILAHNHPHGPASPTEDDLTFTEGCIATFRRRGVHLTDHVVVAPRGWCSVREHTALR